MPNDYYVRVYDPLPEQRVSSQVLKDEFARVEAGFDDVESTAERAIKLPIGSPDQTLNLDAAARANLILAFDASGNITAVAVGGRFRGDWVTATAYLVGDFFRDSVSKNIYAASVAHTSGVLATDIANAKVRLAINVEDVETARLAAAASAVTAGEQAAIATAQADAARAIVNFVGIWSTLTGPLSKPATVYHQGLYYALLNDLADVTASEPGVSADWVPSSGIQLIAYDDRGTLRSADGTMVIVDGLGLFVFTAGSDEPDDDESCFATASGRWLMEAPHWDVVSLWALPNDSTRDRQIEDQTAAWPGRMLRGTAVCGITSLTTVSSTAFTGTIVGATVGDRVIATPPAALGSTDADSARLSFHAYVSATDTVSIRLCNASASTATTNAAIQAAWPVIVIKEV